MSLYRQVADKLAEIAKEITGVKEARVGEEDSIQTFPFVVIVPRRSNIDVIGMPNTDRHIFLFDVVIIDEKQNVRAAWNSAIDITDAFYQKIHTNPTLGGLVPFAHVDSFDAGYKPRQTFIRQFIKAQVSCLGHVE